MWPAIFRSTISRCRSKLTIVEAIALYKLSMSVDFHDPVGVLAHRALECLCSVLSNLPCFG